MGFIAQYLRDFVEMATARRRMCLASQRPPAVHDGLCELAGRIQSSIAERAHSSFYPQRRVLRNSMGFRKVECEFYGYLNQSKVLWMWLSPKISSCFA